MNVESFYFVTSKCIWETLLLHTYTLDNLHAPFYSLSIGTAGSLGASTMTSASSYGSRGAGKRKLKKRGDVSTLLVS